MSYLKARDLLIPDRAGGRIGQVLRSGSWYEADMLLDIHGLGQEGYYIDVGANIGNYSLYFARNTPAKHVFAVEPSFQARSILAEFIRANQAESKISILPFVAASQGRGIVEFTAIIGSKSRPKMSAAVGLDDVIPSGVGLIKIDVEGAEAKVLRGSTRILAEDKPALFVEAHDNASLNEIPSVVQRFGYVQTGKVFNASPTYEFTVPS